MNFLTFLLYFLSSMGIYHVMVALILVVKDLVGGKKSEQKFEVMTLEEIVDLMEAQKDKKTWN